jgi:hypothetical protein
MYLFQHQNQVEYLYFVAMETTIFIHMSPIQGSKDGYSNFKESNIFVFKNSVANVRIKGAKIQSISITPISAHNIRVLKTKID